MFFQLELTDEKSLTKRMPKSKLGTQLERISARRLISDHQITVMAFK